MTQLRCKTRGDTSPQGKPRVYFSCHPEDFATCFETIAQQLLQLNDCAIYYYDPAEEAPADEEYYLDLGGMNLLVLPVTSRLLRGNNRALDTELPYAREHRIPILPLMQESGLEELFSQKLGDLQYLDSNAEDATAISYGDKLKKFLDTVLVSDELAQQIRQAFDAYVFLSYRKKDRKYAQELMRLIHKREFCRDIAIWYDEFLTPGERFNDAIAAALQKSRLFALAVTPNLVDEDNYVMSVEYPMAAQAEKPVLPVEMLSTDRTALDEKYRDLPRCIDKKDAAGLSDALLAQLQGLALRANDADPQHNFFIGLAYLSGVDVEVDHDRALGLITEAAEAGLTAAMEKLAAMYQNGEGVRRDLRQGIAWLEKLTEQAKTVYQAGGSEVWKNCRYYLTCLCDLTDAWYVFGNMQEASVTAQRVCLVAEHTREWKKEEWLDDVLLRSYEKLADISQQNGSVSEQRQWREKALALILPLAQAGSKYYRKYRTKLSVVYNELGEISEAQKAREYYEGSLRIRQELFEQEDTEVSRFYLFVNYSRLADLSLEEKKLDEAQAWTDKARALLEPLTEAAASVRARRYLAKTFDRYEEICRLKGDVEAREQWLTKSLKLRRQLAEETELVQDRRELSVCYNALGSLCMAQRRYAQAKKWYSDAMALREQLLEHTQTTAAYRDLAMSQGFLGDVCAEEGDFDQAERWYVTGAKAFEQIAEKTDMAWDKRQLSNYYENLGDLCRRTADTDGAVDWYTEALQLRQALAGSEKTPDNLDSLAVCYVYLGGLLQERDLLEKALEIYTELSVQHPDVVRYSSNREAVADMLQQMKPRGLLSRIKQAIGRRKKD